MTSQASPSVDVGRLVMGFNVVLVGVLCWLYQLGHLSRTQLFSFWPLALIGIGLCGLLDPSKPKERSGWGLVLIGVLLILSNLLMPDSHSLEIWFGIFPLRLSWPLLLMIVGGYIIWRDRHPKKRRSCACRTNGCRC